MKVAIGSDHRGFEAKQQIKAIATELGHECIDFGTNDSNPVDYPDMAYLTANAVSKKQADRGILICATGIGMCMAANKMPGIRAAQAWTPDIARLSRQHNNANVLCLAGNFLERSTAQEIVKTFLNSTFDGGRHERRVGKMMELEGRR